MTRFKELLAALHLPQKDFSKEIGITYGSFRTMTSRKRLRDRKPSWMLAFVLGVKVGQLNKEVEPSKFEE